MPKKAMPKPGRKRTATVDPLIRSRQIAERERPNMRAVDVVPLADEAIARPDASVPEIDLVSSKDRRIPKSRVGSGKDLHMVVMEPKKTTQDKAGQQRRVVIVDDKRIVGEQG